MTIKPFEQARLGRAMFGERVTGFQIAGTVLIVTGCVVAICRAAPGPDQGFYMIRPATPADVGTILRFIHELAAFEREPDAVKATEASLHAALFGSAPAAEAVIAEGDEPLGCAIFFHNFSTWTGRRGLYLEDLYVTPHARGKGVGTALLRHLAGLALDRDCARFEWAVLDWNEPAIRFYDAVGAVSMDDWRTRRVSGDALVRLAGR